MRSTTAWIFFGLIAATVCAKSVSDELEISPRITNGFEADRRQFPYQAGLELYTRNGILWCGGSVISKRWILSAAHCMEGNTKGVQVYLGLWNYTNYEGKGQQRIFVPKTNIIVHKNWNPETFKNDIALVKLPKPIEFNEYIQRIELPKMVESYPTYVGGYGLASGWGNINKAGDYPDILRWVKMPIMRNSVCKSSWPGDITNSNICIKTKGGRSTCFGDSGGPLALAGPKRILIGVTSYGKTRCASGYPAVFTRVTSYLGWIKKHTGIVGQ